MNWNLDDIPDLTGRVAVVAGPHCPRGHATVRHLAKHGAHVALVGGGLDALNRARQELLTDVPGASLDVHAVGENSIADSVTAAHRVLAIHPRIDLLVNNRCPTVPAAASDTHDQPAAIAPAIGLYAFTATLMTGLAQSPQPRIVTVTALSDQGDPDLALPADDNPQSLAPLSVLDFSRQLHRQLAQSGSRVHCLAADPGRDSAIGSIATAAIGPLGRRLARRMADRGATPQLRAATDPTASRGHIYTPMFNTSGPAMALAMDPPGLYADRKWAASEHLTGIVLTGTTSDNTYS